MDGSPATVSIRRRNVLRALAVTPIYGALSAASLGLSAASARAATASAVTIVLGDQAGGTRALVEAAQVLSGTPYTYRWANFQGAAPLFEAQRAGAVDLAPAGDLPVLTAALGDPDMKIVATRVGSGSQLGILVPADSKLRSVADLKGRTVCVSSARGSISQYQLYGALAQVGLSPQDVNVRFVLPVDAFAAFSSGSIDVWATFDPYFGIAAQQGARVLRDGSGINSGLNFITASSSALQDPAKRAAVVDVLKRYQKAGDWALSNPDAYTQVYATLTRTPIEAARQITRRAALKQHFVSEADITSLQKVADVAFQTAILPRRIDVRSISATGLASA